MKKLLLVLILFVFVIGCQKGDSIDSVAPTSFNVNNYHSPTLRNGRLVFDDFDSFAYLITIPKGDKTEWEKKWQALPVFTTLEHSLKQPSRQLKVSDSHSTQLNRLMNQQGILEIQGALCIFSGESTKIMTGFTGTQTEIDALLSAVDSSPSEGITVYPVQEIALGRQSAQARSTNFNTCQNGTSILLYYSENPYPYPPDYVYGYIKGCAIGYQRVTGLPGISPLKYFYNVTASAEIHAYDGNNDQIVNGNGVGAVFFNWVTDKSTSSASGTDNVAIYGAFASNYPQDIDGYVTIGNTFTDVFGNPSVSQTTISF